MAELEERAKLHLRDGNGDMIWMKQTLLLIILSFLLLTRCGLHEQELARIDVLEPPKSGTETDPKKKLINAVSSGALGKIKEAIAQGSDINTRDNDGLTLVMIAMRSQQFAVLDYLINQGADLEVKTNTGRFKPELSALEYFNHLMPLESENVNSKIRTIISALLKKEPFEASNLNPFIYKGIETKNTFLVEWTLLKGADPNQVVKEKSKHSPLIYLLTLNGVRDIEINGERIPHFQNLKKIFEFLVTHPSIDLNLKVGRNTPLKRAKKRAKTEPRYQELVDRLIELGAKD